MKLKDGATLKMSLLVVPMICKPLVKQPIADSAEAYQHLTSLELADFSSGDSTIWKLVFSSGVITTGSWRLVTPVEEAMAPLPSTPS